MAADAGSALFRAIADFGSARREAKRLRKDFKDLGDETEKSSKKIGDSETESKKAENGMIRLGKAMASLKSKWDDVAKSDLGKKLSNVDAGARKLLSTLAGIGGKLAVFSLMGVAATAAVGPVLSLIGAIAQLSGAVGALPGVYGAAGLVLATFKVGLLGVDDIMKAAAGDSKEFAEATKNLPPSMRDAARAAYGFKGQLKSMKEYVQEKFWNGLAKPIKQVGSTYLPIVEVAMGHVATSINKTAKDAAKWLTLKSTSSDIATSMAYMTTGIDKARKGVVPLLNALKDIFAESVKFLPGMGDGFTSAAKKFSAFIAKARKSGALHEWIQNGIDALKSLGRILKNIGSIFGSVFKAGKTAGRGFLQTLEELTSKLAEFLKSGEGQNALVKLFQTIGAAAKVVQPIVKELFLAFADIAPVLVSIGEKLGPGVVEVIDGLHDAFMAAKGPVLDLASAVGDFLAQLGAAGPIIGRIVGAVATVLKPVVEGLTWILKTLIDLFNQAPPGVQAFVTSLGGIVVAGALAFIVLGKVAKMVTGIVASAGKGVEVVGKFGKALSKLGGGGGSAPDVGNVATKKAPKKLKVPEGDQLSLFDESGKAAKKAESSGASIGKRFVSGITKVFKSGGSGVAKAAGTLMNLAKTGAVKAIPALGKGLGLLATGFRALGAAVVANPIVAIITAIALVVLLIITHWSTVKAWLTTFFGWLAHAAAVATNAVRVALQALGTFFANIWNWIVGIVTGAWNAIWGTIQNFLGVISAGMAAGFGAVRDAAAAVWDAITGVISGAWELIKGAVGGAIDWVSARLSQAWNVIKSVTTTVWNAIRDVVKGVWDTITGIIGGAIKGIMAVIKPIVDFLSGAFSAAWHAIGSVIDTVVGGIVSVINGLGKVVGAVFGAIKDAISWVGDRLSDIGSGIGNFFSAINPFANGGWVPGSGNKDSVNAVLTPGEYVVTKKQAKKWGPMLEAINRDGSSGGGPGKQLANAAMALSSAQFADRAGGGAASARMSADAGAVAPMRPVSTAAAGGSSAPVGDVYVQMSVYNPLPEKASVTASKRIGRAARNGVLAAGRG